MSLKNRVTIQDVAKAVNMSPAMVSTVLGNKPYCCASEKTRALIQKKAKEMGYRPNLLARSLKNGKSHTIGLVCAAIQNEISANEVVSLTNGLLPYGYTTQVIYDRGEIRLRKKACETLLDHGCDAIVISGLLYEEEQDFIRDFPIPVFLITNRLPLYLPERTVFLNFEVGMTEAISALHTLGHRSIQFLSGRWNDIRQDSRYATFFSYHKKIGMEHPEDHIFLLDDFSGLTKDYLLRILEKYPETSAFIASNDIWAMKTIQILHDLSLHVPQDISVIGFDDIDAAAVYTPALSSIRQPVSEAAQEIIKMILAELEGKESSPQKEIPCHLIRRESIAEAAGKQAKTKMKRKGS